MNNVSRALRGMALVCVATLATVTNAAAPIPVRYPHLDFSVADPSLVVVTVRPGAELPPLEECKPSVGICLYSPFWFKAQVMSLVYGKQLPRDINVTTSSHYGMGAFTDENQDPRLVLLASQGDDVVMPLNAAVPLAFDRASGEFYLVPMRPDFPSWLPCSINALREEIPAAIIPGQWRIARGDARWQTVAAAPDFFHVDAIAAVPRYGISLTRLRAHLAELKPGLEEMKCEPEK